MHRKKISLIGGGQIGGNLALLAAQKELGDIVIYDIPNAEGMIKGKALDISQLTPMDGYDANITGSSNPEDIKDLTFISLFIEYGSYNLFHEKDLNFFSLIIEEIISSGSPIKIFSLPFWFEIHELKVVSERSNHHFDTDPILWFESNI